MFCHIWSHGNLRASPLNIQNTDNLLFDEDGCAIVTFSLMYRRTIGLAVL